jgi:hypothetical protein
MTLNVTIKCENGIVLAADSRQVHYHANGSAIARKVDKISTFEEPYNNIGVLICGDLSLMSQSSWPPRLVYSIATWITSFRERALRTTDPQTTLSVDGFTTLLKEFLTQRWDSSRSERLEEAAKLGLGQREDGTSSAGPLSIIVTVAGFDEGNPLGHVFPFVLTDREPPDDVNCSGRDRNLDPVRSPGGILILGMPEFTINVLRSQDFLAEFLMHPERPILEGYEEIDDSNTTFRIRRLKQVIPQIQEFKRRFNIQNQEGFTFSSDPMNIEDAKNLAKLLVYGTSWYSKGLVGNEIKICIIKPHLGIECEWIDLMSHPFRLRIKRNR